MAARLNADLPGQNQWHAALSDMGCMAEKSKHMIQSNGDSS